MDPSETSIYLHRQRHRGLMTGADHPHCGRTLDHLDLGAELEAHCLPLVHVEVDSVLTTATRGRRWGLTIPRHSGHRHPVATGLTLASVDHKGGGGRGLVAGVGGVVGAGGQSLTLGPVAAHEPRGARGHGVLVTIGLVTQLVSGDDGGGVGAEAAIGGHALGLIRGHVTLDRQGVGAWLSAGRASVASSSVA